MPRKNSNSFTILFASRLVEEKGVDILIRAIELSLGDPKYAHIRWSICSDGDQVERIISLAGEWPHRIVYHGKVDIGKLSRLYREADVLFMPSLFLETFGLTALESLASATPVIGFRKGGLTSFIPELLALSPDSPVSDLFRIIEHVPEKSIDVTSYEQLHWQDRLYEIFGSYDRVFLIHDYRDRIGGAEYYLEQVESAFGASLQSVTRYSYSGGTSPWKRRWMFITSLFAFWRGISLYRLLLSSQPDAIWMHSILRYVGPWGLIAVRRYQMKYPSTRVYLSHHDLGLMAPFPQDLYDESQIPHTFSLSSFTRALRGKKKLLAIGKYYLVALIRQFMKDDVDQIIFSPFLEKHIKNHFPKSRIILLPHSYDGNVFHP